MVLEQKINNHYSKLFFCICTLVFIVVALRAFFVPFSHDEAATFFFYIQTDTYMPYSSHLYTNNHFLNSALSNVSYHLFGAHRFALRLPNVLSFVLLCIGVFKLGKKVNNLGFKLCLLGFFILCFNFLDFFALCRGYGLSMGFLILGFAYLWEFFQTNSNKNLYWFYFLAQLSLVANLTLLVPLLMLVAIICAFQIYSKSFFKAANLLILAVNGYLFKIWISLLLFYKEKNLLDSGTGWGYWRLTYKSLLDFLFGASNTWIEAITITLFSLLFLGTLVVAIKSKFNIKTFFEPIFIFSFVFFSLVVTYYLLKKLFGINYPEDRTGIFLFLFFVIAASGVASHFLKEKFLFVGIGCASLFLITFIFKLNFSVFGSYFFHTYNKVAYDFLVSEQTKSNQTITIGGNPAREMVFAFLNFRGNGYLNGYCVNNEMQMNTDYQIALKTEKPYYNLFYDELKEIDWEHVILKRKKSLERKVILEHNKQQQFSGTNTYFDVIKVRDTSLATINPLEAEVHVKFLQVSKPINAFLVFSVNDSIGKQIYYKAHHLNWFGLNLDNKTFKFKLTTGSLPLKLKDLSIHVWNIDEKPLDFEVSYFKISQLYGEGVNVKIPEKYYELIEKITKKPIL